MFARSISQSVALLALVACGLSGCSTITTFRDDTPQAAPPSGSVAQCTIDLRPRSGKPKVSNYTLEEQATVSQVLTKSGASKRYSNYEVELYRQTPQGQWHKMAVEVDGRGRVGPMHDYHIRPGDRLVVREDSSDPLENMLNTASSGLIGSKRK